MMTYMFKYRFKRMSTNVPFYFISIYLKHEQTKNETGFNVWAQLDRNTQLDTPHQRSNVPSAVGNQQFWNIG